MVNVLEKPKVDATEIGYGAVLARRELSDLPDTLYCTATEYPAATAAVTVPLVPVVDPVIVCVTLAPEVSGQVRTYDGEA